MAITKDELLPLLRDPDVAAAVHSYADTDLDVNSLHRTIGPGAAQAKPGNATVGFEDFTQYRFTPNAPTGILVTSNIVTTNEGNKLAEAIVTWTPVTQNTDGTSVNSDELDCYLVSWRVATTGDWTPEFEIDPTTNIAYFLGLLPGTHIDVRVAARNLAQNVSAYGFAFDQVIGADLTAPNQPSKPIVASLFGAIRAQWDGKDSVGATMALDFDHVDVHVGSTSTFLADDTNKIDSIPTLNGGAVVLSYTDYGTNHYVKFRAVDKSGNISTQSVASDSIAARQGVDADFQNISATKITAGKLSVDVGLAGRLLIGPLDANGNLISPLGARIEIRNDGIHIFNSSNVEVGTFAVVSGVPQLNISGPIVSGGSITGTTITGGTLQTATSGKRVVIDTTNTVSFYRSGGTFAGSVEGGGSSGNALALIGAGGAEIDLTGQVTVWGNVTLTGPPASNLTVSGTITCNQTPLNVNIDDGSVHRGIVINSGGGQTQAFLDVLLVGSRVAAIASNGNVQGTGAYTTLSDAKAKQNINYLTKGSALAKIKAIKPAKFEYIENPGSIELGFIAQDLQSIIPEAVVPFDDLDVEEQRLGTRLDPIVATLIIAIQELADKVK